MVWLDRVNAVLWHDVVLYVLVGVGLLFTLWTRFGQSRALTHGVSVIAGRYDRAGDPGAINHFQALSAALSATVGLGNIAGVALAVSLGGPGAAWCRQPRSTRAQEDVRQTGLIKQFWIESGGIYGYRKIHDDLREVGEACGKHRVRRLMRLAGRG